MVDSATISTTFGCTCLVRTSSGGPILPQSQPTTVTRQLFLCARDELTSYEVDFWPFQILCTRPIILIWVRWGVPDWLRLLSRALSERMIAVYALVSSTVMLLSHHPGHTVGIQVLLTIPMMKIERVVLHTLQPPLLHVVRLTETHEPLQRSVIRAYIEHVTHQIMTEMACEINHSQQLLLSGAVVALSRSESFASISNYSKFTILLLRQNCPNSVVRRVRVQPESPTPLGVSQNRLSTEGFPEGIERVTLWFSPYKWSILFGESCKRLCYFAIVSYVGPIVTGDSQECTHVG